MEERSGQMTRNQLSLTFLHRWQLRWLAYPVVRAVIWCRTLEVVAWHDNVMGRGQRPPESSPSQGDTHDDQENRFRALGR